MPADPKCGRSWLPTNCWFTRPAELSGTRGATDKDAINSQIVAVARELVRGPRRRMLHCLARLDNPRLCSMLFWQQLNKHIDPSPDPGVLAPASPPDESTSLHNSSSVDFFNLDESAARGWLEEFSFFNAESIDGQRPHLLVGRLAGLGNWLVRTAARMWHDASPNVPLWISIVDEPPEAAYDVGKRLEDLTSRYPELVHWCKFVAPIRVRAHDLLQIPAAITSAEAPPLTHAYVTAHDDEVALADALTLRHHLDFRIPVVVALSRKHGVAKLIHDNPSIDVFSTLDQVCTRDLVLAGSYEPFARALHEHWRRMERDRRRTAGDESEPETWDELDESRQRSNFAQARNINIKLQKLGRTVTKINDWAATGFTFSDSEIDALADLEHQRWVKEREADGWQYDEKKDPGLKTSPYLIPFEQLPDEIAE